MRRPLIVVAVGAAALATVVVIAIHSAGDDRAAATPGPTAAAIEHRTPAVNADDHRSDPGPIATRARAGTTPTATSGAGAQPFHLPDGYQAPRYTADGKPVPPDVAAPAKTSAPTRPYAETLDRASAAFAAGDYKTAQALAAGVIDSSKRDVQVIKIAVESACAQHDVEAANEYVASAPRQVRDNLLWSCRQYGVELAPPSK